MASRKNVKLDDSHRQRIAAGECSLAALADELGITRQTLHVHFRKRCWPTKPADDSGLARSSSQASGAGLVARGAGLVRPVLSSPAASAPSHGQPSQSADQAVQAPAGSLGADDLSATDFVGLVRNELANAALLAIARSRDLLAGNLGAQGLKAAVAALSLAADQIERAGYALEADATQAPTMSISVYSDAEMREIQAAVERQYQGESGQDDTEA